MILLIDYRLHIMTGRIPDCSEQDRPAVIAKMEKTFVDNLTYAADRLKKVSGRIS